MIPVKKALGLSKVSLRILYIEKQTSILTLASLQIGSLQNPFPSGNLKLYQIRWASNQGVAHQVDPICGKFAHQFGVF